MVHLINLVSPLLTVHLWGDDEIKLVRKKLKWPYPPFEIPNKILTEWRKIGDKGEMVEKNC